ncbi:MAG TPA: HlyD family type I secretion periplasmic adaptor subunit [Xanthobacteraceae bacterium]|nr:HlyD family type I secretion periplasmic adaptor subunit [Xanthobacteraceae bacterium]
MARPSNEDSQWYAGIPRSARTYTIFGIVVLGATFMGFGVWGSTAPIAGAVVTSGVFVATGQNKIIQHLEGGVIREILVREGDIVEQGQTLMLLDEVTPRAELRRLELRRLRQVAMDARLQAEMREEPRVNFPPDVLAAAERDPNVARLVESERMTFEARRSNLATEIATINEGINALQERIQGSKVQLTGVHQQIKLLDEEIEAKSHLLQKGLVRKPELLVLQRAKANLQGEIGRLHGDIGDARERISRAREQIVGARKTAIKTAVEQLHEVRAELNDVQERMLAAKGVLDRVRITAPVKGVVVKLRYHTPGGVVEPGKPIMEILPLRAELILEGRVRPQDIDTVRRGHRAMVRLTALNQRITPMVAAEVIYVSADALPDEKKGVQATSDVYVVRVRLNEQEAAKVPNFTPTPGMPAEMYIKINERTFLQYLMRPIEDTMSRAFREY